jgi:transcriptional regulator with XRE-family HTH domain
MMHIVMPDPAPDALGAFLRARREHLEPAADGARRRTAGLRRSEVAARANISVEWYTRLEQGRGGGPSAHVLEAVCDALQLREDEREHAFVLAFGARVVARSTEDEHQLARMQRVLDNLHPWPAYVKSSSWDVRAWNAAAAALLTDYPAIPAQERNILRILFTDPTARERVGEWREEAKLAVATFRLELARWNAHTPAVEALVEELRAASPEFAAIWELNEVGHLGEGVKRLRLGDAAADAETVTLQYESLSIDAFPGAGLVVYSPVSADDAALLLRAVADR